MSGNSTSIDQIIETFGCVSGIQPDENGWVPVYACNSNYFYYPSFGIAIVFTMLFTVILCAQTFQAVSLKKIRLSWVVLMCTAWEVAGLAIRVASTKNQQSMILVYFSNILILLAPLWLNAFVYIILGRMIYFFLPEQRMWGIRARKIALWFVCGDITSFVVQATGGAFIKSTNPVSTQMLGIHIYMGGIAVQEFIILIFTAFALRFRVRMLSFERIERGQLHGKTVSQSFSYSGSWRALLYALLVTLAFITVRIIYRLVEFAHGFNPNNYLAYHEWCFYLLDPGMILMALLVMNVVHPGTVLIGAPIVADSELPKWLSWKNCLASSRVSSDKKGAEEFVQPGEPAPLG